MAGQGTSTGGLTPEQRSQRARPTADAALRGSKVGTENTAADTGHYELRLTYTRRLSVTAIVPADVDRLWVRPRLSGLVLTSRSLPGQPSVAVFHRGGRRTVELTGQTLRRLLDEVGLMADGRHARRRIALRHGDHRRRCPEPVAVDVYATERRHRNGVLLEFELEVLRRGWRR